MKKIIYMAVLLASFAATAAPRPEISDKVLKAFNETFSSAENVTWEEFDNKNCQANFKMNEIIVKVLYDDDGNLLQTIRYYTEKNLPPNIIIKLKKKYPGKEIFTVTEVASQNDIVYHITLKDEKNWYIVKSDYLGNLEQTSKFKNAGE
ncbi:MAG: hypothetical protein JJE22_03290 [Bacteroidia bacterium]|nr:hypothetical protein [Bacteroidia bacterium]